MRVSFRLSSFQDLHNRWIEKVLECMHSSSANIEGRWLGRDNDEGTTWPAVSIDNGTILAWFHIGTSSPCIISSWTLKSFFFLIVAPRLGQCTTYILHLVHFVVFGNRLFGGVHHCFELDWGRIGQFWDHWVQKSWIAWSACTVWIFWLMRSKRLTICCLMALTW